MNLQVESAPRPPEPQASTCQRTVAPPGMPKPAPIRMSSDLGAYSLRKMLKAASSQCKRDRHRLSGEHSQFSHRVAFKVG